MYQAKCESCGKNRTLKSRPRGACCFKCSQRRKARLGAIAQRALHGEIAARGAAQWRVNNPSRPERRLRAAIEALSLDYTTEFNVGNYYVDVVIHHHHHHIGIDIDGAFAHRESGVNDNRHQILAVTLDRYISVSEDLSQDDLTRLIGRMIGIYA